MSEGVNKVILLGNLGADPELRYTANNSAVLNLRVATNTSWYDKEKQERQERTEWHSVTVWGPRAEGLAKFLVKGRTIHVEGELRTSTYEKDGETRYRTEVHAHNVIPVGKSDEGNGGERAPSPAQAAPRGGKPATKRPEAPRGGRPAPSTNPDDIPY